jgi:Cof subfamily protein (haloacid dehalogenase superfamily)
VTGISLVVSDVDGTLVTPDKQLTNSTIGAVRLLDERGIAFTIVSSRPPIGLRMLIEPLSLRHPIGAFSGGAIVEPSLEAIEQHLIPELAARRSVDMLAAYGADVWVYTTSDWLASNPNGDFVLLEQQTILTEPSIVSDFNPYLSHASKVVGSSKDFTRLDKCEVAMRDALGAQASVARSQPYYLDVTPPGVDKGTFIEALAKRLAVPLKAIAVLGDMDNDLAMFRRAGLSIAMGNASIAVKRQANCITAANADDGFALAIKRYVLEYRTCETVS